MKKKLAIIGNGMATCRLLDDLIRRDGLSLFDIVVFGEESHGGYNRILLSRILSGASSEEIVLKPHNWYAEQGIQYRSGQPVTRLSPAARRLWTQDGSEFVFDLCIFATGSTPRIPPTEGLYLSPGKFKPGVFAFRTIEDCERIRASSRPAGNAVVLGGGLLGLEAAKGLADYGMHVTVIHLFDVLMNNQLDKLSGELLRKSIEKLGIFVQTGCSVKEVVGSKRVEGIRFDGGSILPADLVVIACGIKPRIDLAKDSDIPTNMGILVSDRLATSIPGIYAVGECAEHDGKVYGIVQPIWEQCAVLADVLTGANVQSRYRGSKLHTRLKVAGVEVASMGVTEAKQAEDETVQVIEERRDIYKKLVIRNDRLIGAILIGDTSLSGTLVQLFERGDVLPPNRLDLFASGDFASIDSDPEICNCHHVTRSTIQECIASGKRSLAELGHATRAGTGCGSCRGQLTDLILKTTPNLAIGSGE